MVSEDAISDALWGVAKGYARDNGLLGRFLGQDFDDNRARAIYLTPRLVPSDPTPVTIGHGGTWRDSGRFTVQVTISRDLAETVALRHARAIGDLYYPGGQPTDHVIPGGVVRCQRRASVSEAYPVEGRFIRAVMAVPYFVHVQP